MALFSKSVKKVGTGKKAKLPSKKSPVSTLSAKTGQKAK